MSIEYIAPRAVEGAHMRRRSKDVPGSPENSSVFEELSVHLKFQGDQPSKATKGTADIASIAMQRASTLWKGLQMDSKAPMKSPFTSERQESSPCASPASSGSLRSSASSSPSSSAPASPPPGPEITLCGTRENNESLCSLSGAGCSRRSIATSRSPSTSMDGSPSCPSSSTSSSASPSPDCSPNNPSRSLPRHEPAIASFLSGTVIGGSTSRPAAPMAIPAPTPATAVASSVAGAWAAVTAAVCRADSSLTPFSSVAAASAAAGAGASAVGAGAKPSPLSTVAAGAMLRKAISTPLEQAGLVKARKEKLE